MDPQKDPVWTPWAQMTPRNLCYNSKFTSLHQHTPDQKSLAHQKSISQRFVVSFLQFHNTIFLFLKSGTPKIKTFLIRPKIFLRQFRKGRLLFYETESLAKLKTSNITRAVLFNLHAVYNGMNCEFLNVHTFWSLCLIVFAFMEKHCIN